jgi:hypothetical protein
MQPRMTLWLSTTTAGLRVAVVFHHYRTEVVDNNSRGPHKEKVF